MVFRYNLFTFPEVEAQIKFIYIFEALKLYYNMYGAT